MPRILVGTALDRSYDQLEPWLAQIRALGNGAPTIAFLPVVAIRQGDMVARAHASQLQRRWGFQQLEVPDYAIRPEVPDSQPGVRAALAREARQQEVDGLLLLDLGVRIPVELWWRLYYCYEMRGRNEVIIGAYSQWLANEIRPLVCVRVGQDLCRVDARNIRWAGGADECPAVYIQGGPIGCVLVSPGIAEKYPFVCATMPTADGSTIEGEFVGWCGLLGGVETGSETPSELPAVPLLMPLEAFGWHWTCET